jgi:hypothetical protein
MKTILSLALIIGLLSPDMSNAQGWGEVPVIKLFSEANFRGDYIEVEAEWSARSNRDPWNDRIASIYIPAGWEVWVYEHSLFRGDYFVLTNHWNGRNRRNWCGRISSIRIVKTTGYCPPAGWGYGGRGHSSDIVPVTVFEDSHFDGASLRIGREWSAENSRSFWNDRISSIYVPEGYRVIAYEHTYFRGRQLVIEGNWSAPRGRNWWNDEISSIRVERIRDYH